MKRNGGGAPPTLAAGRGQAGETDGIGLGRYDMNELASFHKAVMEIYGHYFLIRTALINYASFLSELVTGPSPATASLPLAYGPYVNPDLPGATYRYETTFGDAIAAARDDGPLHITHRRSVVVLIVASWEVEYRGRIAAELGLNEADDVKSDVFRDLTKYRNAILHAGGKLRDVPRAIHFFRKGEQVSLSQEHMERIFQIIVDDLNRIGREYYDSDPNFSLDIPLNF